jgi:hypothetical protein
MFKMSNHKQMNIVNIVLTRTRTATNKWYDYDVMTERGGMRALATKAGHVSDRRTS